MIISCNDAEKQAILDYIGKDYGKCLYIYIDLCKYGLDGNPNFHAWVQRDHDGNMTAVITEYYKGIQLYSRDGNLDAAEISGFLSEKAPKIILGIKETIDKIREFMPGYQEELGTVGQVKQLKYPVTPEAYSAGLDELKEIASLVAEDEGIGKPYGFDSLYQQYKERKEENFGRNYILRDPATREIICHAGTYAELPELAVIGGVITAPKYRGKGYSKGTLSALCKKLLEEGKDVFSFYYIPSALHMHMGVGFQKIGTWAKLVK